MRFARHLVMLSAVGLFLHSVPFASADDAAVWAHARAAGLTLVSKDSDFVDLAVVRGVPPHVVWVQAGNQTTAHDEALLRRHAAEIRALAGSGRAVLALR